MFDDTQLTDVIRSRRVRPVRVGMDAVRRSRPDAVVLHVRPGHHRPRRRRGYNDANWCSEEYDALYEQQKVELDRERRRRDRRTRCCGCSTARRPTSCCSRTPTSQAYRTDRFEGWLQQPAETGPVLFTNTSPTYVNLTPIEGADDGGGLSPVVIVAIVAAGVDRDRWRRRTQTAVEVAASTTIGVTGRTSSRRPEEARDERPGSSSARSSVRSPRWRSCSSSTSSCSGSSTTTRSASCSAAAT